ncbi:hypothetical protein SerAS12_0310 [Serratia sp. AS12]|uniref:hypothetical protein n=1 Tax=Serratia TaxID=613 RepID=UPI00020E97BF|nr:MULTISPECIES: hypothetical protein [Serratia]AEF43472.1 hypothetical protein SerAS9_0310 [Serratia plymuthica AS9]AEF48424.1 hypothetical protein SerAS12_0310 [Serratia sp. AS12]AEG26132.1 hypothetical protein SerAS13_0309 [Serratia sp. AS13]UTN97035.1 hypothetical protein NLX81_01640 [Serratia plymuthica]
MKNTDTKLDVTYAELLDDTKEFLRMLHINQGNRPLDSYERGLRSGACLLWTKLALTAGVLDNQCNEDYNQLRLLAGWLRTCVTSVRFSWQLS